MKTETMISIIIIVLVGSGLIFLLMSPAKNRIGNQYNNSTNIFNQKRYQEIVDPAGFVNTDGITIGELVGKKVILVDFMTYSCINCQRTFPYMTAWYEMYKDQGLEIVGIHTPEFAFEKNIDNVRSAMKKFGIEYPVVLDNNYGTWRAYENNYWPRKYLIDIHGNIVYDHIGEGGYNETEKKIQELLIERAEVLKLENEFESNLVTDSIVAEASKARSPETYFGSSRNEYLANGPSHTSGLKVYELPKQYVLNRLYLGGEWKIESEYAESVSGSMVVYRYNAKSVFIVAEADRPTEIEITVDSDKTKSKTLLIEKSELYTLVDDLEAGEHLLEIRVKNSGVRLFAFTFG